jgi:hypothetical protein
MVLHTNDGRLMAISQILYGQYHIWDICVSLKTNVFIGKTTKSMFPWPDLQYQNSADSLAEKITQMPQNLSAPFVCPSPKHMDIIEKRLFQASIVRGSTF